MVRSIPLNKIPVEAWVWMAGLAFLAISSPDGTWTVCPLHNLGLDFCPGCGLGRSVSLIFRGEWSAAWQMHPLGFVAIPMLLYRSFNLIKSNINNNNHGKSTRPVTGN